MSRPRFSFVVPLYEEAAGLPELERRLTALMAELDGESEVILVDDGSSDATPELIASLRARDPRFKSIELSRNFGHQIAITAGLDHARGDAVVIMDADLQDPPELVPELVRRWEEGYEVVYAVRGDRPGDSWRKRLLAGAFYRLLGRAADVELPRDVGDFRLVDRRALEAFRSIRERNRYVRGLFAWVGFRQVGVPYRRPERHAGESKYPFRKSLRLGVDAIVSFSDAPLRIALAVGFAMSLGSFVVGIGAVVVKAAGAFTVPGWTSILFVVSFLGGVQLVVLGMVGLYVGRIYDEAKQRPLYLVRSLGGFAVEGGEPPEGRQVSRTPEPPATRP